LGARMSAPAGPLSGVRVIDWTVWQHGPVATAMLGDLGADVIKIEERQGGDLGRGMLAFDDTGVSPYFEVNNRNKRSLAVNVKHPDGAGLVRRLAAKSDVFVQNFRPTIAEKVGLDYETLRAENPLLIYASGSAYGPKGPERTARAYDLLGQARSGLLLAPGGILLPEKTEPMQPLGGGFADQMGAIMLAYGVLAGLIARERHGLGQRVDTSLFGSMLALRGLDIALELMTQRDTAVTTPFHHSNGEERYSRLNPGNPLWNSYRCADGKWISMALLQSDPHWENFLDALDRPQSLADDPRFADHNSRCQHARACVELLDDIFAGKPRENWLHRLLAKGDMPITAMNSMADIGNDVQALENNYVTNFEHPAAGPTKVPGFPVTLSQTPASIRYEAPEFGQHTEEILMEILEMDWDDIAALREQEVIL
jgi:crotonobetainyl-CoA:carnitine CoA-transferase CaiB-like acyl-CoA transferase